MERREKKGRKDVRIIERKEMQDGWTKEKGRKEGKRKIGRG